MTFEEFVPMFREMTLALNKQHDDEKTSVYFDSLRFYEAREVSDALKLVANEDEYFPTLSQLLTRIKSSRKPLQIVCEYCSGSGFELVYSSFVATSEGDHYTHKCGGTVSKAQYESDPITYRMFAKKCRCREGIPF